MPHSNRKKPGSAAHPRPYDIGSFRERYGLTVGDAARLAFSTDTSWRMWESGERRMHPAIWAWVQHAVTLPSDP